MKGIWDIIKTTLSFVQGIGTLFLGILVVATIVTIGSMATKKPALPQVADGSVLVLAPSGIIMEQPERPDPILTALEELDGFDNSPAQTSFHGIIRALERAKEDDRIAGLAILTDRMWGVQPSHMHDIANAIRSFKESGKKVFAISTAYSQSDYALAAEADHIYMNPEGTVLLTGYGRYVTYFKGLLDKLGANVNVFRVGTFKSAVEPYIRDDMSPAAKEANQGYLNDLWSQYTDRIETAREMDAGSLQTATNNVPDLLRTADGSLSQLAIDMGLVDAVMPRVDYRAEMRDEFGEMPNSDTFKQISYQAYLAATNQPNDAPKKISVITAQGEIVMGSGPVTVAAADTLVGYIRSARNDPQTAAIVLRVNSPGGSSFASELIRQELEAAQQINNLPVVASFGPVAASGGYWISATADEIWAAPSTITGSIGIFGIIPTFEETLAKVGISTDGVGTTNLSGAFDVSRDLSDPVKDIIQQNIESGYRAFLSLVATGREMTTEDVDSIAQGRVWSGRKAQELGLVDNLGTFDEAIAAAARLAELDEYRVSFYREGPDKFEAFLNNLLNSRIGAFFMDTSARKSTSNIAYSPLMQKAHELKAEADFLLKFNDPMGRYALCLTCRIQ